MIYPEYLLIRKLNLILFIATLAGIAVAFLLPVKQLLYHTPDDAFFYLKTAWNFAQGNGSTFDTIAPTNGYHPLWFLILSGMFFTGRFAGIDSPEAFFRLSFVIGWHLFVIAVWLSSDAINGVRRPGTRPNGSSGSGISHYLLLFILTFFFVFIRVVGSEAIVSVAVLAVFFWMKTHSDESPLCGIPFRGALLVLLFLARIDYLSNLIPALILGDALTARKEVRLNTAAGLSAMVAIAAVVYFSINYTVFGHLLTISASLKSAFPRFVLFENIPFYLEANPYQFVRAVGAILVCAAYPVQVFRHRKNEDIFAAILAWSAAGCVLFLLQTMSFNAHKLREWYTSIPVFVSILILVQYSFRWRRISWWIIAPGSIAVFAFLGGAGFAVRHWDSNYDFARTLKNTLRPDEPVLIVDCAGIVGYFSQRNVLCGDGLVNGFEYMDSVKAGRLEGYLKKYRIPFYATYTAVKPDSLFGAYIDRSVTGLGGMRFVFDSLNVVLKAPFEITNIRFRSRGEWILFRFDDDK